MENFGATESKLLGNTVQSYGCPGSGVLEKHACARHFPISNILIVAAPKVNGFDTGFVCYYRGGAQLRQEDLGSLWKHFVLNEIMAHTQSRDIRYWRNKRGQEVDFVLTRARGLPIAIECKWAASGFSPRSLLAFRKQYPDGENFVVANDVDRSFMNRYNGIQVKFVNLDALIAEICPSK
ncbi:DUF4143 domain-containing protein [Candidatus Poribacteria bacterium]|nr:DUF4143 domain-containing protein [Candidatus Poribacteria bacterium]